MAGYYSSEPHKNKNRITLNDLKDQLYSLNRQLLLAMQCHNQEAQNAIQNKIEEVRERIECISLGQDHSNIATKSSIYTHLDHSSKTASAEAVMGAYPTEKK